MIPASIFTGGQLWVENADGSIFIDGVPGEAVDIRLPYIAFYARRRRAAVSWTGNRLVIVLYHIREAWRLSEVSRDRLTGAGFHIHTSDVLTDPYLSEETSCCRWYAIREANLSCSGSSADLLI